MGNENDNLPTPNGVDSRYAIDADFQAVSLDQPAGDLDESWIRHFRSEQVSDDLRINLLDFVPARDEKLVIAGPPTFSISLFIAGAGRVSVANGPFLDLAPDTLVLFHAPHESEGRNQLAGGRRVLCLDFRFSLDFVDRLGIPSLSPLIRAFTTDCSVQDTLLLGRPLSAALRRIGEDVMTSRLSGIARQVFLQAKALELLAHIVAIVDQAEQRPAPLTRRDRDKVAMANALLTERFAEAWTITSLARAVGLNDRKLKSGFRQLVGHTVHGVLEQSRLEAAAHLLRDDRYSVTDVALAIGYANPSHFAKLFKRRYGAAPQDWRRRLSIEH
jgi:AraC-like DNA-binding protein